MKIHLSGNLIRYADYNREVAVDGDSVYGGICALVERFPPLRGVLLDGDRQVRGLHRVFLDGELVAKEDLQKPAPPDSEISILTAIAGG